MTGAWLFADKETVKCANAFTFVPDYDQNKIVFKRTRCVHHVTFFWICFDIKVCF